MKSIMIKNKFLFAFSMVFVMPFLGILISWVVLIDFNGEIRSSNNTDILFINVFNKVESSFSKVHDYKAFYEEIYPYLSKFNGHLKIIDIEGRTIFDSENKISILEADDATIKGERWSEGKYTGNMHINPLSPIIINGKTVAIAIIINGSKISGNSIKQRNVINRIIIYLTGLVLLTFSVFIFLRYFAKGIVMPMKQLSYAAKRISEGDMDYELKFEGINEVEEFSSTFETMRVKIKELLKQKEDMEDSRKELVASISHDLRTPLTSIKGYIDFLSNGTITDQKKIHKYFTIIKNKVNFLDALIEDLFEFSKMELGKLEANLEKVNSRELLESIFSEIENDLQMGNIGVNVIRPIPSVPIMVDPRRISQVIYNIVNNMKRFVNEENGLIIFGVEIESSSIRIVIEDNGKGIDIKDLEQVFEKYYQIKDKRANYSGVGLGLAICKHIVELHSGRIWAESKLGKGSTFSFTVPTVVEDESN